MARLERVPVRTDTRAPGGTTAAYVLDGEETTVLVDPAASAPQLDRTVDALGVDHLLVTHPHPDHVGAVADYAADTGATVWCRRGFRERFEAACGLRADRTFVDGTDIGPARVVDTPGHAPDHVALAVTVQGRAAYLVGDMAVASGSVVVGAPEGDLRSYLTSLRRLRVRAAVRWYPAHGPVIEHPRATAERLIAHRLDRERRVRSAVESGARTVDAVIDAAYDKDVGDVEDLARATVRAHLEKLQVEGAIRIEDDRVEPIPGR